MTIFCRAKGPRSERILASPQFHDGVFRNPSGKGPGLKKGSAGTMVREMLCGEPRRYPAAPLPAEDPRAAWGREPQSGLRATWLGHSTLLIELDGVRLLTDPVWGERASPSRLVGPKRFQPVPVALADLPDLDAVVLSHDHYDHLCEESVVELARRGVPFVTTLGVGEHLEGYGVPAELITELDWWESARVKDVEIHAAPSQHFSGRGLRDRNRTLWSSMAMVGPKHKVFFSGDTGLTEAYGDIRAKLGPFDLVMLEVGAFHPAWGDIHLGPDNALRALELLGGGAFLPVHWGTFNLAFHAWDQPAERLLELAPANNVQLVMPKLGAPVEPLHVEGVDPWWRAVAALEKGAPPPVADPTEEELMEPID